MKALKGVSPNSKLPRKDKNQIVTAMKRGKSKQKNPYTAQETIPYETMYRDGICRVTDRLYSKTIEFQDINYQLAMNDDKTAIFEHYCDFLNYFDSSIVFQLSFINQSVDMRRFTQSLAIPPQDDSFDDVRMEYADMLKSQLAKGNNGLVKRKFITFGIEADTLQAARQRLERIESDVMNNFKVMGAKTNTLNGYDRLEIMHHMFHADSKDPFLFNWSLIHKTGLSTKDFIAPTSFDFRGSRTFVMGRKIGATSHLQILAPELSDRLLAEYLDMDSDVIVNLHVKSIDQTEAIKMVKRKITDLDAMKIDSQKKASRQGYDYDLLPTDLVTFSSEAKRLLEDLQSRNERMFLVTILVTNLADSKQKLENNVFQAAGIAQKYNCSLKRLDFQQEAGLMSTLPLGLNQIPIERGLTTSGVAVFVPFTSQEIHMDGDALYYGLNALSNNMILADRKQLKNPNGLILGTPGSGKSFSAKREITNAFLITNDSILICDPESEYSPLVEKLNGTVIRLSPTNTKQRINPLDINLNYSEDDDPVTLKSDFVLSLCELVMGGKNGLEPIERTLIDRCVRKIYQPYIADPAKDNIPILEDLYDCLRIQDEPEAQRIATALEIYVHGSLNVFNAPTNINLDNRIVCFDIRELGKSLRKIAMLIVQDQVWNRVTYNRFVEKNRATRYYIDEFHLLFKEPQTASYSVEIWKRFRKWGGIPTGITQNVKELLESSEIENIFDNSDFVYMLNQAPGDRQRIATQLNISPHQLSYVTNSNEGEGLIYFGNVIIPFLDRFPKQTELYRIMSTKANEIINE